MIRTTFRQRRRTSAQAPPQNLRRAQSVVLLVQMAPVQAHRHSRRSNGL